MQKVGHNPSKVFHMLQGNLRIDGLRTALELHGQFISALHDQIFFRLWPFSLLFDQR
jgi:hypothetical protein